MMNSRNEFGFLVASVIGVVLITFLVTTLPLVDYFDGAAAVEMSSQPKPDPLLRVLESTTGKKPQQYVHNWDDNPVAYIPEATMVDMSMFTKEVPTVEKLRQYPHNWDDNPVAYLPEATVIDTSIFAKEVPTVEKLRQYPHNWDDNPVSTIPEATISR